jgi:hypothetical protein
MPARVIISSVSWPWLVGSGKLAKPCLRMQAANASSPSVAGHLEQLLSRVVGATGESYTLTAADVGHTVLVQETASNAQPHAPRTSVEGVR